MESTIKPEYNKPGNTAIEKLKAALFNKDCNLNTAEFRNIIDELELEHIELQKKSGELNERTNAVITTDTEEYEFQQILRKSESKFRAIVEGAPDPIFIQADMTFAYLNPAACILFGVESADELIGTPVIDRFHPDYYEKIRQRIKALNQEAQSVRELFKQKFIRVDGSEVWVETAGEPITYNGKNSALVFVRDISQRVKAEEAIHEQQRQLASMISNLPGFVYRCKNDENWTMLYLSPQFEKITGYPAADFIHNEKRTFNDIIKKEFQPEIFKQWEKVIAEKSVFEAEYPVLSCNNQIKWIWERGTGVFDNKGNVLFLEGYIEDITPRKQMEEKLKESEEHFRLVMENSLDAILITSPDGSILNANKAACDMFQMTEAEIQRVGRKGIVNPNDPNLPKMLEERKLKGYAAGELTLFRKNGTLFPADITTSVFRNSQGELHTSMIIRDITERKQAEAILRESEERFSTAFKASPAPLVISEINTGLFIDVNDRWVEMLGYSREEQIGKTSKEVGIWHNPSERDRVIKQVLKNGFFKDEYIEFNTKGREVILALWSAEIIMHSGRKLMLSMIQDITARVKAERELRRLKENLEVEVEQKTKELRERIAELERFHAATIEREYRIKELRDEITQLKADKI